MKGKGLEPFPVERRPRRDFHHVGGRITLAAALALGAGEAGEEVLVYAAESVPGAVSRPRHHANFVELSDAHRRGDAVLGQGPQVYTGRTQIDEEPEKRAHPLSRGMGPRQRL